MLSNQRLDRVMPTPKREELDAVSAIGFNLGLERGDVLFAPVVRDPPHA